MTANSVDHDCNALALHAHRLHTYCYAEHVAEWQKHFKPPNVMLLKAEELKDPKNRASMVAIRTSPSRSVPILAHPTQIPNPLPTWYPVSSYR